MKTIKQLNQAIGQIRLSGEKLNDKIQGIATDALLHAIDSGDTGVAARLVDAVKQTKPRDYKVLVAWFKHHGILLKEDEEGFKGKKSKKGFKEASSYWLDFKEEKKSNAKPYDPTAAAKRLVKTAQDKGVSKEDTATALREALAMVETPKF